MKIIFGLVLFSLFLVGCAKQNAPTMPTPNPSISAIATKASWEEEWENVLREAKKEGKVVVYSALGVETTTYLRKAFKEKYGVDAEFMSGVGVQMAQKLLTERKAGLNLVDIYQGSASIMLNILKPIEALEPIEPALILPEIKDPRMWLGGKMDFVDQDRTIFPYFAYVSTPMARNTNLVKQEDIKSYRDLLTPRWKGKISIGDVTVPSAASYWFAVNVEIMGLDYMRELVKQEPVVVRDWRLQMEWLAQGKYPVTIAPHPDTYATFKREGAPIDHFITSEGSYKAAGTGQVSLIKGAPHPNAARLYLNWLLGREAQTLHSKISLIPSARVDVPTDHLDPLRIIKTGEKYVNTEAEDFIRDHPNKLKLAREIFGSLMR